MNIKQYGNDRSSKIESETTKQQSSLIASQGHGPWSENDELAWFKYNKRLLKLNTV